MSKAKAVYPDGDYLRAAKALDWIKGWYANQEVGADNLGTAYPEFVRACQEWQRRYHKLVSPECADPENVRILLISERKVGRLSPIQRKYQKRQK